MVLFTALLLFLTAASAEKDTNYYPWGTNPNSANPMFWNDASNVLTDLKQFQALYIKFHSCVWSPYASGSNSYACTDGNGAENDEYWYMGGTPCFRANAAFSLYGVLIPTAEEGRRLKKKTTSMCNQATFINSFFTTYGAPTMSASLGIYDDAATTTCSYVQGSNSNNNNKNNGGGDSRDGGGGDKYSNYMSYTTGCEDGQFVTSAFHGKYCDGNKFNATIETLDTYNAKMQDITCTQIWDYDVYVGSGRELGYGSLAESILYYSKSCSTTEYAGVCPDPWGIKSQYNLVASFAIVPDHSKATHTLGVMSTVIFCVSALLIALSVANLVRKKRLAKRDPFLSHQPETSLSRAVSQLSNRIASMASAMSSKATAKNTVNSETGESIISDAPSNMHALFTTPKWEEDPNRYKDGAESVHTSTSTLSGGSALSRVTTGDARAALDSVEMSRVGSSVTSGDAAVAIGEAFTSTLGPNATTGEASANVPGTPVSNKSAKKRGFFGRKIV